MFVPLNTTKPIFYADPDTFQMIFDEIITTWLITICKAVLLLTGFLLNIIVTLGFSAIYQE